MYYFIFILFGNILIKKKIWKLYKWIFDKSVIGIVHSLNTIIIVVSPVSIYIVKIVYLLIHV